MDEGTCEHAACTCMVEGDQRYCSTECEEASRSGGSDECECGHPDCV